ncbi:MAG: hypothetical protein HYW13_00545 [Planctomycetes bacterium]|nr:hypothetical protein [Planctomycetota bacterium]
MLFILITALSFVQAVLTCSALAESSELTVEVIPASVGLPPEGKVKTLVIVRNPTKDTVHNVRLSWLPHTGIKMMVETSALEVLAPQGVFTRVLRLSREGGVQTSVTIPIRVDYTRKAADGSQVVSCVAVSPLKVEYLKPEIVDRLVEVQPKMSPSTVNEKSPGKLYLIIKNISNMNISVKDVSSSGPEFLNIKPNAKDSRRVSLMPLESCTITADITVTGAVQSGKHLILFTVPLEWEKAGHVHMGNAVATHEVEVGIPGVSEILTLLGVPSFLVLPGFLMLVVAGQLWKLCMPSDKIEKFPFVVKSPEFWLLAITLSGAMAWVYPQATRVLCERPRDYLKGYDLTDVVYIWATSILFGAVVMGVITCIWKLKLWWKHPSEKDDPISLLKKLHRQGLGVCPSRVRVKDKGELFLLEPWDPKKESFWVGSFIIVRWTKNIEELEKKVEGELKGNAATLAGLLTEGQKKKALEVSWQGGEGPQLVNKTDIAPTTESATIVRVE